jgi:hypothetical protein
VRFLRQFIGKLLVNWDGALIHRSQVSKIFLVSGGAMRLHLERLPEYALDLDPYEGTGRLRHTQEVIRRVIANATSPSNIFCSGK